VKYLPPFELIRQFVEIHNIRGEVRVNIAYQDFIRMLRTLLAGVEVDETWYAAANPDLGDVPPRAHFQRDGYFEARLPFPVRIGQLASGQAHFNTMGYREGRLPFPV
jgi:hypothetical protein